VSRTEALLREALVEGAAAVEDSDDLFARVRLSIDDDRHRHRQRIRRSLVVASLLGALASVVAATIDIREGVLLMDWWILELLTNAVLIAIALWLGPFIKRFGKSYAADVFRANPRTGKSYIVLMDIAYYLIFVAYILFTVSFEPKGSWEDTVNAAQLQHETARVGGIVLIIGVLHGLNILSLPVMGRLLTLNRRLDETAPPSGAPRSAA
jgi:type III secretory pathway component EscS